MELWQRLLVILIVVGLTLVLARLIDRRIMRANRSPEAMTRYRVLRRTSRPESSRSACSRPCS